MRKQSRLKILGILFVLLMVVSSATTTSINSSLDTPILSGSGDGQPLVVSCLGDSITNGYPYAGTENTYPSQLLAMLDAAYGSGNFEVVNHGVNGYRANQVLADLQNLNWMAEDNPDFVLLMVGGNDLAQEVEPDGSNLFAVIDQTVAEVQAIVDVVTAHTNPDGSHPQIIVSAFIPNRVLDVWGSVAVGLYNSQLESSLIGMDLWITTNWDDFYDPATGQAQASLMYDTVHPNADGYAVMAENWFEVIYEYPFTGIFYVSTTGNDSNPGTIDQPWRTIQHAAETVVAGDTVYIKEGTYNEQVIPQNPGSSGNYITYTAYPGHTVTIDGTGIPIDWGGLFEIEGKSYSRVSRLIIINSTNAGIFAEGSSNIIIEKNYVYNTYSSGIAAWSCDNIIIDANEVELACNDGHEECITVAITDTFEIKNNHVHHGGPGTNGGEGIDIKDGSSNGKVYKNYVHDMNRLGIYVDAWDKHIYNIDVFQNIVHNCPAGFIIASEQGGLIENIRLHNNIAYNNIHSGLEIAAWHVCGPMKSVKVINNDFYANGNGIYVQQGAALEDIIIRNNIASKNIEAQIVVEPEQNVIVDHNLIDGYRGAWKEIYGDDYVEGDPKCVNPSAGDFHLLNISPAIDKGSSIDAPSDDYGGNPRPQGAAYDIGAFEYPLSSNITFWTEGSTMKIRPFDSPGSEQSIHIKAAKNEYEAFQVAVTASEGLTGVNVSVSNLTGSEGSISREYIRLYREAYMNVVTPSNIEGEKGLWPDALIPAVDPFFDEMRNAFPFDVPAGQNRAIWVDVFVPPTTNAGNYTGNLTIMASGKNPALVPITLTVWNFTLPSTASLISAFGFDGWELLVGHYGNHDHHDQIVPLSKIYGGSGLKHRISLESVTGEDWSIYPWPPTDPIDWTEFDANWGPFLDGIDLPHGPQGARLTSLSISTWGDNDEEKIVYWQHYVSHFKDKGWFERLFDYTWDEPSELEDFVELKKRASLINQADPDLRVLVTTNIKYGKQYDLIGIVDIWVPIINEMHDKPGEVCWYSPYAGNQRDQYDELLAAGNELWWYQSCESHGCYELGGECNSGWPSYMIDIPAIYTRIREWQSFKYGISGELYFSTNYAFEFNDNGSNDPWNNQYYFGGNGDGTLFYPGRPDKIGGTHHIPIESIRLKMIREGMEDYEYMKMLQDLGYESFARSQVDLVVTNAYTLSHGPAALYTARENMAKQILAHGITYYVATTGDDSNPGTINQPWRTIQHAVENVGPGDTIFVREGTYNEWIRISNSGLPGQPITLRGYPNETVILNGSGLEWRYGIDIGGADYWTIRDLVVQDYIREGLRGFGFVSWSGSKGITLRNLQFSLVGTPIKFHAGGEDIVIEDIYAHDYDNGGFDCGPAGSCFNLTIRRFTALGAGEGDDTGVDGFAVEEGNNIMVEDCIAEGHPGDGFDFKSDNTTLRRVISRNNARNNIKLWGLNSRLENCLSHDSGLTNLVLAEGGSYTVINCLIANRDTYGYLAVVGYDLPLDTPLRIHNTIFYNDNPAMGGTTLYLGEGVNLTADHNIYYNHYREDDVICAGFLGGQCFSKDDINDNDGTWFTASGCGEHSVYADLLFVNATIHDYHLTEESPAVNAGTAEDVPRDDIDGNPRPQGAGFDIGPYEYVEGELTVTWVDNDFNESTLGWHYDHFDNIQDGIDAVAENGTVFVYNGTYYENVVVNKTIDLIGENRNITTIDGSGTGDVVYVAADRVNISGFSIRNGSEDGICILCCSNHTINGNNIYNNSAGISLYSSNRSSISNNTLHHNTMEGVVLWKFSNNNVVGENNISSNQWGIEIGYSSDNRISDNEVFNNYFGIEIDNSTNITVENNMVYGNQDYGNQDYGIELVNSSNNNITANHIISNVNNGIDLWYNATGNRIRDNWIEGNNGWGIELGFSSNNLLYNNYFNNTNNAWDNGNNSWNITKTSGTNVIGGEYIGGNYWLDYTGVDNNADGLGDTPYNIAGGSNKDYLPLVSVGITITSPENKIYASQCIRLNFTVEPEGTVLDWIGCSLDGGANVTITGNTTVGGLGACEHNIVVYARGSNGNTGASNKVYFTLHLGDINGAGVVNVLDLQRLAWAFNSQLGDPGWNENADLNCDNKVNIFDLQLLAWNFENDYTEMC